MTAKSAADAHVPPFLATLASPAPRRISRPASSSARPRRCHGVYLVGHELASVYSAAGAQDGGVIVVVGNWALQLSGAMKPAQARAMARALTSAADAVEPKAEGGAQ